MHEFLVSQPAVTERFVREGARQPALPQLPCGSRPRKDTVLKKAGKLCSAVTPEKAVKRIMKAHDEVPTCGSMPIERKSGPMTMPPPMPSRPAVTPASSAVSGKRRSVARSHCMSAGRYSKPAATLRRCPVPR